MIYYDISCFRHYDKLHPSHIAYRMKYSVEDKECALNETVENTELARKILLENVNNQQAETALNGHFSRFVLVKYESYF